MGFKKARENAGLTQLEAAKALGVSDVAVSYWENGISFPNAKRLPDVAKLYGCTVDELLKEE